MTRLKRYLQRLHPGIRKPLIFLAGVLVLAAGAAMIVLPGPGWVVIFLGLAILATEFVFAQKIRDWLIERAKKVAERAKRGMRTEKETSKHKHQ